MLTVLVLAWMGVYIGGNHQVLCLTDIPLTMAPNSYDDQYIGCPSAMEVQLMDPTRNEFAPGKEYSDVWENAVSYWNESESSVHLPDNFKAEYGAALLAYTACSNLYPDFNAAVRTGGKSTTSYEEDFHFKSFDFLVTKAIEVLRASQTDCYEVYRGVASLRFTVSDPSKPVRFGQFSSSSMNKDVAEYFGTDTFFTIRTCFGAKITDYSYFPKEEEVLIPPYETFKVVGVQKVGGKTQITLHSDSKSSNFNCGSKTAQADASVLSVDNRGPSSNGTHDGYSGMDARALAALNQMDHDYLVAKCKASGAAPSSLNPGVPTSFLLWGFLLFSGSLHSMGSL